MTDIDTRVQSWLDGPYSDQDKQEILRLQETSPEELQDAFCKNLEFGTGGLRGIMGVGTNRMNIYTVRAATQGLANYVNKQSRPEKGHSAVISYDTRNHSRAFAEEAAKVLAANGIRVFFTKNIRPTPFVSFACRYFECTTAIMITASHNPPEYNGYKVYWNDGGQVLPPHDVGIIAEVNRITSDSQVRSTALLEDPLISLIGNEADTPYLEAIFKQQCYPMENQEFGGKLHVIYSALHGTGATLAPQALKQWGFTHVDYVDAQMVADPQFSTVKSPNPEERSALQMGIDKMLQLNADVFIANDPDADRVGVAILHAGQVEVLNGNQIAVLALEHICQSLSTTNQMPANGACVKSIVTTELFKAICSHHKCPCYDVLPGFKYIAEKIRTWEREGSHTFIFGAEESYGYLKGTQTRDKDAIIMTCLLAEAALHAKKEGKTLLDRLDAIYAKYGFFYNALHTVRFPATQASSERMIQQLESLSLHPPEQIASFKVLVMEDYLKQTSLNGKTGVRSPFVGLPQSHVIRFLLEGEIVLTIRPSGTESKVKIYLDMNRGPILRSKQSEENAQSVAAKIFSAVDRLLA